MSYTPPSGNVADLKFGTGYAVPAGDAANLSFVTGYPVTGFCSTQFGTPTNGRGQAVQSLSTTQLGTPAGWSHFNADTIGRVTQWAWPWTGYTPTQQTWGIYGFQTGRFGSPSLWVAPIQPAHQYCLATGAKVASFGTPSCSLPTTAAASGFSTTAHGAPSVKEAQPVAGWQCGAFGQPNTVVSTKASGVKAMSIGVPTHTRVISATTVQPKTRFGTPGIQRSNTYKTYRISTPTRFGRPKGYSRFNYPATAVHTTQLGIPTSFETHHAWRIEPNIHFGQPLLKRTPLC